MTGKQSSTTRLDLPKQKRGKSNDRRTHEIDAGGHRQVEDHGVRGEIRGLTVGAEKLPVALSNFFDVWSTSSRV